MNVEILLSLLAVVASSVSAYFAFLVWKYAKEDNKHKVSIVANRMTEIHAETDIKIPVIAVKVVNHGKRPIKVLNLYLKSVKNEYVINTPYLPRLLAESDDVVLSISIDNIITNKSITIITELGVVDSNKNVWKITEKNLSQLNKDLSDYKYKV